MQQAEIFRLLRQILVTEDAEDRVPAQDAPCHIEQYELPGYIEMEFNGEDPVSRYPTLHARLADCEQCQTAYTEIKELLLMEQTGVMVDPPSSAQFDLSYLQHSSAQETEHSSVESIKERITDGVKWHLSAAGRMWVQLSDHLMANSTSLDIQPAFTKSSGAELFKISSQNLAPDMVITVTGRELQNRPEQCSLAVDVDIPSRGGWPNLAGAEVVLTIEAETVDSKLTDAFGGCLFDGIEKRDLPRVRLQIRSS